MLLICLFVNLSICSQAQKITNELQGYFYEKADSSLYHFFVFDGNGKVNISGYDDGLYFQKGDTVIIYPDKSIFKFLLKDHKLYGVSDWVANSVWEFNPDSVVAGRRSNAVQSDRFANLLFQYYELTPKNQWAFLEDTVGRYSTALKTLCDSGLSKACLDLAGLKISEQLGGVMALLKGAPPAKKQQPDPEIMKILQDAIRTGDTNGYAVLGSYHALLGDLDRARDIYEQGNSLGCKKCALALFSMELEKEAQQLEASDKKKSTKKPVTPAKKKLGSKNE
ncbi:MAG: hypothetical protein J7539_15940 [Niabella sp.]|nr:hypothetical protein [Niabella sp.]